MISFTILGTPHAKKAFFISFLSLMLSFFCGTIVMIAYVTTIFSKTGSSLSEKTSSLLIAVTTLVANFVFLNIVERFNRMVCNRLKHFFRPFKCESFSNSQSILNILLETDTLYRLSDFNCGKLLFIWCILFAVAQPTRLPMDASIYFFINHFYQLHGIDAGSVHYYY